MVSRYRSRSVRTKPVSVRIDSDSDIKIDVYLSDSYD